jgi:hypothetical protein
MMRIAATWIMVSDVCTMYSQFLLNRAIAAKPVKLRSMIQVRPMILKARCRRLTICSFQPVAYRGENITTADNAVPAVWGTAGGLQIGDRKQRILTNSLRWATSANGLCIAPHPYFSQSISAVTPRGRMNFGIAHQKKVNKKRNGRVCSERPPGFCFYCAGAEPVAGLYLGLSGFCI